MDDLLREMGKYEESLVQHQKSLDIKIRVVVGVLWVVGCVCVLCV